ncbi:hypothetical protein [Vibrio furnissii]|uniref:hypothetical protein n=1 Tax=Vibrio furnissii TaxID=29494 RepID=UPI001EEBCEA6|nr:hypothetical protein [Vibrio furnissii]MCG6232253.1 hypothetical protein [Vibrio furnissii]MCG6258740.1 hypothetical protein [Vibrio furnissii]
MLNQISDADFHSALDNEDELGSVIRVHLHIEYYVNELLKLLAVEPQSILSMKLDYSSKLDLLVALGVDEQTKPMLFQLGRLRNKFAHDLGYQLNNDNVGALYDKLPSAQKQLLHTCYKKVSCKSDGVNDKSYAALLPKSKFTLIAIVIRRHLITLVEKIDGQLVLEKIV